MKKTSFLMLLALAVCGVVLLMGFARRDAEEPLRHVVVFKYKAGATEAQIRQVTDAFRALKDQIPGIVSFEHGVNNSPEGRNLGFTHVYVLTFEDAAARDAYLPHPAHQQFGALLGQVGIFEDAFVVDFVPAP
jgi:hypothetical protein